MSGVIEPVVLVILDGWGISEEKPGNAVKLARTKNLTCLQSAFPATTLETSGEAVGLMAGQMGDSNVGHLNIGAGRVVYQDLLRISRAVSNGQLAGNPAIQHALDVALQHRRPVHLMGLVSDGGVHSHIDHIFGLLEECERRGVEELWVHGFLDGRDVLPQSATRYIEVLEEKMDAVGLGKIASICGRYYAMDRDQRWDRVQKAYDSLVLGKGFKANSAMEALTFAYERGETDEFVLPTVIVDQGGLPVGRIQPDDVVIFFNFRSDRAREITRAFLDASLRELIRPLEVFPLTYVSMTEYAQGLGDLIAFPPDYIQNTLGEYISHHGLKQLRVAETEKYAHVTFFFNGGREDPFPGEDRVLIPSPPVSTYDLQPEMSAYGVKDTVVDAIEQDKYHLVIVNFANMDMVGHTGNIFAAMKAAEAVDDCVGQIAMAIKQKNGRMLVIADHGNAEQMMESGSENPYTAHTSNPVPCILVDQARRCVELVPGILADVAPTVLELIGLNKPSEMTGVSLIRTHRTGGQLDETDCECQRQGDPGFKRESDG
jgi:2,3-bisphosphoglycerate-independent phosphoglycerate mutase